MLIELASLIIINTRAIDASIDNNNLGNNNSGYNYFVPGDSRLQIEQREREAAERAEQSRREADAREGVERASRGGSYTGTGGEVTVIGKDTQYFNCVKYAKAKAGISASIGNGGRRGINSQTPQVGSIGVERSRYHAVYVESVNGNEVIVSEANYLKNHITMRVLHRDDFLGFISS